MEFNSKNNTNNSCNIFKIYRSKTLCLFWNANHLVAYYYYYYYYLFHFVKFIRGDNVNNSLVPLSNNI